jgi:hypothetical protein
MLLANNFRPPVLSYTSTAPAAGEKFKKRTTIVFAGAVLGVLSGEQALVKPTTAPVTTAHSAIARAVDERTNMRILRIVE